MMTMILSLNLTMIIMMMLLLVVVVVMMTVVVKRGSGSRETRFPTTPRRNATAKMMRPIFWGSESARKGMLAVIHPESGSARCLKSGSWKR